MTPLARARLWHRLLGRVEHFEELLHRLGFQAAMHFPGGLYRLLQEAAMRVYDRITARRGNRIADNRVGDWPARIWHGHPVPALQAPLPSP